MGQVGQGLISDEIIKQIRDRVDIADIIGQHVSLIKAGPNLKGLCPFHQETSPSFTVSPSRQIFHCFGCGAGGNVFTFLSRVTGGSFQEIVRDLGRKVGIEVEDAAGPVVARDTGTGYYDRFRARVDFVTWGEKMMKYIFWFLLGIGVALAAQTMAGSFFSDGHGGGVYYGDDGSSTYVAPGLGGNFQTYTQEPVAPSKYAPPSRPSRRSPC